MSLYVVDASVALKWYLPEPYAAEADRVLDSGWPLHAPDLLLLEFDSALCKRLRHVQMAPAKAEEIRSELRDVPLELHPCGKLSDEAFHIARRTRQTIFDCTYVALAIALNGRMVTADERLIDGLKGSPFARFAINVKDVPGAGPTQPISSPRTSAPPS